VQLIPAIAAFYAVDGLRGDGYAVRLARLNMVTLDVGILWALCWIMEIAFGVAYFARGPEAAAAGCWTFVAAYAVLLRLAIGA
jgi:hypothetical protein